MKREEKEDKREERKKRKRKRRKPETAAWIQVLFSKFSWF